jgi:hypothetical protein
MSQYAYELLSRSNFETFDRDRYEEVVEIATSELGLDLESVLAVAHDGAMWAACRACIFRADLRGVFRKRVEVGTPLTYREISEVRVEPSGPHTHKVVLRGPDRKRLSQIDFSAAGPARSVEGAYAECQAFYQVLRGAWSMAR